MHLRLFSHSVSETISSGIRDMSSISSSFAQKSTWEEMAVIGFIKEQGTWKGCERRNGV